MTKFWPGILPEIEEGLRKRTFPCPNCGLDYEMDGDGVEAAKNAPVRRKCPKCGNWMRVMMLGNKVYDVSADSSLSPDDLRKKWSRGDSTITSFSEGSIDSKTIESSPFDDGTKFSSVKPNQGYIDTCRECGENDTIWFGQWDSGGIYTILKCESCLTTWAASGRKRHSRSVDDWTRIEDENQLKRDIIRKKVNDADTAEPAESPEDCFIATAAYGSPDQKEIDRLREFRDETLLQTQLGEWFISKYYKYSPPLAEWISRSERRKRATRTIIIRPSLWAIRSFEKFSPS